MTFEELRESVGIVSKDVKLNLGNILKESGAPGLSESQIFGVALACAYASKDQDLVSAIAESAAHSINEDHLAAARTASIMMAMNNVYYRTIHLSENKEVASLPAKLRMTGIATHGVDKIDFELYSLAISSMAGCGMCINAHMDTLEKSGLSTEGIQSSIRIASVIQSAAQALSVRRLS